MKNGQAVQQTPVSYSKKSTLKPATQPDVHLMHISTLTLCFYKTLVGKVHYVSGGRSQH
jgi:hypothetical protein